MRSRPWCEPFGAAAGRRVRSLAVCAVVVALVAVQGFTGRAAGALPEPTPDPDAAREEADRILGGAPFVSEGDDETDSGDSEGGPVGGRSGEGGGDPPAMPQTGAFTGMGAVARVIMWILLVALAVLAGWVLVRAIGAHRRRERVDEVDDDLVDLVADDADDLDPLARPADEWRAAAGQAEAAGDWRAGIRLRYRALLAELIAAGVIDDLPGRTAGEYRRAVTAAVPTVGVATASATDLFERPWYGLRPTGAAERDRFVELEAEILGQLRETVAV